MGIELGSGVIAKLIPDTPNFEVFCNRCAGSIGTMKLGMIREAIFNCLGRGGILCPDCRKRICDGCGEFFGVEMRLSPVKARTGQVKLCLACLNTYVGLDRKIDACVDDIVEQFVGAGNDAPF